MEATVASNSGGAWTWAAGPGCGGATADAGCGGAAAAVVCVGAAAAVGCVGATAVAGCCVATPVAGLALALAPEGAATAADQSESATVVGHGGGPDRPSSPSCPRWAICLVDAGGDGVQEPWRGEGRDFLLTYERT